MFLLCLCGELFCGELKIHARNSPENRKPPSNESGFPDSIWVMGH